MTAGKLIIVAVRDEQSGRSAVRRAELLRAPGQDRLVLLHVSRLATLERVLQLGSGLLAAVANDTADRYAWLRELAAAIGPDVPCEILHGEPGVAIADYAREHGAGAIVVAAPRDGQAREIFLGSTALRVLRSAPCPVVVARDREPQPYSRVLVGIDLDDTGQRVALASTTLLGDVGIEFVHAYRVPQEGQLRMRGVDDRQIAALREFARGDIEPRLRVYRTAFPRATIHVEHGHPASVILEHVMRTRPDVLVLGRHRGSSVEERALGSVTQFLLYACPTDVLLVP
jgi:nucleotide-binding universal stress UspA family protein